MRLLNGFFAELGVSPETAAIDSERESEHHVSPETLAAMEKVLQSGLAQLAQENHYLLRATLVSL